MNKKIAVRIINGQIEKLSTFNSPVKFDKSWKIQTKTYIELFFGSNSDQSQYMKDAEGAWSSYGSDPTKFLEGCIELIDNVGLYKKPKQNFLYTIPGWLAALAFPLMLTFGIAIGNLQAKSQMINQTKNKSSIITDTAISLTKNLADTVADNKNNPK